MSLRRPALALLAALLVRQAACAVTTPTAPDDGTAAIGDVASDVPGAESSDPGSDPAATDAAEAGEATSTGFPAGWIYTQGSRILVSDGTSGTPWMGRGVNLDDVFLCGYNNTLWMDRPDTALLTIAAGLMSDWKPSFVRVSLGMASYPVTAAWTPGTSTYATMMTGVIDTLGSYPGVYVLVTLRSDLSMIGQDQADGDPEATGLPSSAATTPDSAKFPTGTDATYVALVDTFAHSPFVLFGLSNEPGGNQLPDATIAAAMQHAVDVIRAEEDLLGVPHHVVTVQGNTWTSKLARYVASPIAGDNVAYEVHGYPPTPAMYDLAGLPVILGEYGSLDEASAPAFYADVEARGIPNLAWDFEPLSDCSPDLLSVTTGPSVLTPTASGTIVQAYLLSHAP